jgi:hypothetical protein
MIFTPHFERLRPNESCYRELAPHSIIELPEIYQIGGAMEGRGLSFRSTFDNVDHSRGC